MRFRRLRAGERVARKWDCAPADWSPDDVVPVARHPSRTMGGGSGSPAAACRARWAWWTNATPLGSAGSSVWPGDATPRRLE